MVGLDEAAFQSKEDFQYIQLPMALDDQGIVFGISTKNAKGEMTDMYEACKTDSGPFEYYERIPICDYCMGLPSMKQAESCKHMGHIETSWGGDERVKISAETARLLGLSEAHLQEQMNIISGNGRKFFIPEKLDQAFRDVVSFKDVAIPQVIYVGVDPANNGKCFLCGVAIFHYADKHALIGGIMMFKGPEQDYVIESSAYFSGFIARLRYENPGVPIVIGIEVLPSGYAALYESELKRKRIPDIYMVYNGDPKVFYGVGVPCNAGNPDILEAQGRAAKLFDGYCRVSKNLVASCNINPWPHNSVERFVLETSLEQLKNFEIDENGRVSGKKNGIMDDFCSAIIKACQVKNHLMNPKRRRDVIRDIHNANDTLYLIMAPDISVADTHAKMEMQLTAARDQIDVDMLSAARRDKFVKQRNQDNENGSSHNNKNIDSGSGASMDTILGNMMGHNTRQRHITQMEYRVSEQDR